MPSGAVDTVQPAFSPVSFALMLTILGVSVLMYVMLVRRWTSRRQWVSLARWCRESGFRLRPARREALPGPLRDLVGDDSQIRFHLCDPRMTLVQFETRPAAPAEPSPRFNVLIRHRAVGGPVSALRPASQKRNLIDLLPLGKYASMTLGERFVVFAANSHAARELAESPALTLVPRDLGLIFLESHVVLDFSNRPFDPIEFGRMIALSEQLARVMN